MKSQKISVILPVYNGEKYIKEAIYSILNQTYRNFELLVINDGSTDNTSPIVKAIHDKRLNFIDNSNNKGLINVLNYGLQIADGEFIARMDADDISLPRRFEKQLNFLNQNPDVGMCGTMYKHIGSKKFIGRHATNHTDILWENLFRVSMAHPVIMMRKSVVEQNKFEYDIDYLHCEDYEMYIRLGETTQLANIPEVLLHYRIHQTQIRTIKKDDTFVLKINFLRKKLFRILKIPITEHQLDLHNNIVNASFIITDSSLIEVDAWFRYLADLYLKTNENTRFFLHVIAYKYFTLLYNNYLDLNNPYKKWTNFELRDYNTLIQFEKSAKFLLKCFQKILKLKL